MLMNLPAGCSFRPRCSYADAACLETPEMVTLAEGREVRCFHPFVESAA